MSAVPWRRVVVAAVAVAVALSGVVFAFRAEGFKAIDATVPRATRWFVSPNAGDVVLADGFSGKILASVQTGATETVDVVQSAGGVAVLDRSAATARSIDPASLRVGPPQSLSLVAAPDAVVGIGQAGLVAVDPESQQAVLLPPGGDQVLFDVGATGTGDATRIAPDGAVWTLAGGRLTRVTTTGRQVVASNLTDARFTLVGSSALVFDVGRRRVMFADGQWVTLPDDVPASEIVLQQPGPTGDCGWLGGDDLLWCIGTAGVLHRVAIDGLGIDGGDLLSIAGEAGALVRRQTSSIVRVDWRGARMLDGPNDVVATVPPGAALHVAASVDLIWIDEVSGNSVWAVNPWGIEAIDKGDDAALALGESGEVLDAGDVGAGPGGGHGGDVVTDQDREPDNNGIDDPPVAVNDPVTARTGISVSVAVTANDYDPDGEAIALVDVGSATHGTVDIASATTAVYLPTDGYVGVDEFRYTIVDGNGTQASATVTLELLASDAANQPPVGTADTTETGTDTSVIIDVLLNDVDPERDGLRIDSFTPPDIGGTLTETIAPSGLPGLEYEPLKGRSGTATFQYRPVDSFGAIGEPVEVTVEIAQPTDDNRPPIVLPDAVRTRRDVETRVAVLANDRDPDGDRMQLAVVQPLPPGLDVRVDGDQLVVVARAGMSELTPFGYTVSDAHGHTVTGSVLVVLISELEPNRPPVANADSQVVVAGATTLIDVLANDTDPDGDPVILVDVSRADTAPAGGSVRVRGTDVEYSAATVSGDDVVLDRLTYRITDGKGNTATGQVAVRVLPEAIESPPFARDDPATTMVDVPVTIDVLRNDGDPSGERPTLVGNPGCPSGGTAVTTPDERVTFTPPKGLTGVFNCSYEVINSQGLRARATIVVNVLAPPTTNVAPIVGDAQAVVLTGSTTPFDVLDNAIDPDAGPGDVLSVLSSSTPTLGTATREGRVITYRAGDQVGVTTITFTVGDGDGGVTTGRLVITIEAPKPIPPEAADDTRTIVAPAVPTVIDVLTNDSDEDGLNSELRVSSASLQSGTGSVTAGTRTVTFVPSAGFVGRMVANYTVIDPQGFDDVGQVTLIVLPPVNRPPVAVDDTGQVVNGGTVTIPIALNDFDPDNDSLTYSITNIPDAALGSVRLDNVSLVFTAAPGAAGTAIAGYTVSDGQATAAATVAINVLPCSAASPDAPDVYLQTGYQQPIAIDLGQYAVNGTVVDVGPPLGVAAGTYTPPAGENGNIVFTYTVRNSCRLQDVGQVTIDVNQDPVGATYEAHIGRNAPYTIPVTALASDAEPLTIGTLVDAPSWVAISQDRQSLLVNPSGSSGSVTFTAIVVDPGGLQVVVPIKIELVNLAPIANPDVYRIGNGSLTISPLANDTDPDGDALALQSVPATVTFPNGVEVPLVQLPDNQIHIAPGPGVGAVQFTYTAVDALGLPSAPATVTITVNSPPVAPDVKVDMAADSSLDINVPASDPDGDPLVLTLDDDPAPLTYSIDGLTIHVTAPPEAADTQYTLRYTVSDPSGSRASGLLLITVGPPPTTTTTTTTTTTVPPEA